MLKKFSRVSQAFILLCWKLEHREYKKQAHGNTAEVNGKTLLQPRFPYSSIICSWRLKIRTGWCPHDPYFHKGKKEKETGLNYYTDLSKTQGRIFWQWKLLKKKKKPAIFNFLKTLKILLFCFPLGKNVNYSKDLQEGL